MRRVVDCSRESCADETHRTNTPRRAAMLSSMESTSTFTAAKCSRSLGEMAAESQRSYAFSAASCDQPQEPWKRRVALRRSLRLAQGFTPTSADVRAKLYRLL
jgi:hypothetical protein